MLSIDEAYKIGDRMAKPWQWATIILSAVVAGLLYVIATASLDVDNKLQAEEVVAKSLTTTSTVSEK